MALSPAGPPSQLSVCLSVCLSSRLAAASIYCRQQLILIITTTTTITTLLTTMEPQRKHLVSLQRPSEQRIVTVFDDDNGKDDLFSKDHAWKARPGLSLAAAAIWAMGSERLVTWLTCALIGRTTR
ncbi:hypothetical protein B0T13DRAFT_451340 [Neurospora crassa]|nr:hypothetical protein B0T13DRAFT_451340 [Neurospora crassa]